MLTSQVATPEVKCADCAIRHRGICGQVSGATHARLAQIGAVQSFAENRSVWDGEPGDGLSAVLISGVLRMQQYDIDGRRQISSLLMPGDIISHPGGQVGAGQIEASTAAQICRFDRVRFQRLQESTPELGRAVYMLRLLKLDQLRLLTWSLGVLSVDERVCAFLAFATTFLPYRPLPGGGGVLSLDMPRADIADFLSTSIESISRISRRLDAAGAIRILAPSLFEIPDLNRLVVMGCMQDSFGIVPLAAPTPGYVPVPVPAPDRSGTAPGVFGKDTKPAQSGGGQVQRGIGQAVGAAAARRRTAA